MFFLLCLVGCFVTEKTFCYFEVGMTQLKTGNITLAKHWFAYVEHYLHNFFQTFISVRKYFQVEQTQFLRLSQNTVLLLIKTATRPREKSVSCLQHPLGFADFQVSSNRFSKEVLPRTALWTWEAAFDPHFQLNITFVKFYFSSVSGCSFAKLHVMFHQADTERCFDKISSQGSSVLCKAFRLRYCGIFPKHSVFSPCRFTSLAAVVSYVVIHDIQFLFSVVDTDTVFTSKTLKTHSTTRQKKQLLMQQMYILHNTRALNIWYLCVNKIQRIKVQSDGNEIQSFFDGPGSQSPDKTLQIKKSKHAITSSFQCVVYAFSCNDICSKMSYFPWNITKHQDIRVKSNQMFTVGFPANVGNCLVFCVFLYETSFSFHINVSVTGMSFVGMNPTDCRFGGISTTENMNETTNHCMKLSSTTSRESKTAMKDEYQFPNLYSFSNKLVLVLYFYQEYVSMKVSLKVSVTECNVVQIDPCALKDHIQHIEGNGCTNMQLLHFVNSGVKDCHRVVKMNFSGESKLTYHLTSYFRGMWSF